MKKILLDTNAYVRFLAGDDNVLDILGSSDVVYLSVFVLGELYAGFRSGTKEKQNRLWLSQFLTKPGAFVLDATQETAEIFGEVKAWLKKKGKPLPINDIWIAAHALESGSVLVTFDEHFTTIPGIRLWDK